MMKRTNCLTAAMLEVGMRREVRMSFTREQVAQYCALSGDDNAIHRDRDAAKLRFPDAPDIIVPGGLLQISVTGILGSQFPGDGTLGLTFTPERMRKPVCPDEEILVALEITKIRGPFVEIDIHVYDPQRERIGGAQTKVIAPDDAYRQWWEKQ